MNKLKMNRRWAKERSKINGPSIFTSNKVVTIVQLPNDNLHQPLLYNLQAKH